MSDLRPERRRPRSRGYALVLAILLMSLVGTALLALTGHLAYEAKRTERAAEQAQLRQVVLAGREAVRHRLAGGAAGAGAAQAMGRATVALPTELAGRFTLEVEVLSDAARLRAVGRTDRLEVTYPLTRQEGGLRLGAAPVPERR